MHNLIYLIGRLTKEIEIKENENGKRNYIINIGVTRSFKNMDGIFEKDFFDVILWEPIASNVIEYCKKGDLVGIKGRIQMFPRVGKDDFQDGMEIGIIAEKVSFLSNSKGE